MAKLEKLRLIDVAPGFGQHVFAALQESPQFHRVLALIGGNMALVDFKDQPPLVVTEVLVKLVFRYLRIGADVHHRVQGLVALAGGISPLGR